MTINKKLYVAIIIFSLFTLTCKNINLRYTRPVAIKVLDSKTELPIKGINVKYRLIEKATKLDCINLFPVGGSNYKWFETRSESTTNENGIVIFSKMNKKERKYEDSETIFINLQLDNSWELKNAVKINKKYFGLYIGNMKYCIENPELFGPYPDNGIDIWLNGGSLSKSYEFIVVKLRRYNKKSFQGTKNYSKSKK